MSITKDIKAIVKNRAEEIINDISQLKEVLKANEIEKDSLLDQIGIRPNTEKVKNDLINLEKKLEGDSVFEFYDIIKLAIKYRLSFMPSGCYRGKIPSVLASKLRDYCHKEEVVPISGCITNHWPEDVSYRLEQQGEDLSLRCNAGDCYVLAPSKLFSVDERFVRYDSDPLLFIVNKDQKFQLIHQWGNDTTTIRSILFYPIRTIRHLAVSCMILFGLLIFCLAQFFDTSFIFLSSLIMAIPLSWFVIFKDDIVNGERIIRFP